MTGRGRREVHPMKRGIGVREMEKKGRWRVRGR
jgi:hypothetical protein